MNIPKLPNYIDRTNKLSIAVVGMDKGEVIKNLKIGIIKDLHKSGFFTQKQMEQAVKKLNREVLLKGTFKNYEGR